MVHTRVKIRRPWRGGGRGSPPLFRTTYYFIFHEAFFKCREFWSLARNHGLHCENSEESTTNSAVAPMGLVTGHPMGHPVVHCMG